MPTNSTETVFVGVDTHADTDHVAVVDSLGRHLDDREFPTDPGGYRSLPDWCPTTTTVGPVARTTLPSSSLPWQRQASTTSTPPSIEPWHRLSMMDQRPWPNSPNNTAACQSSSTGTSTIRTTGPPSSDPGLPTSSPWLNPLWPTAIGR